MSCREDFDCWATWTSRRNWNNGYAKKCRERDSKKSETELSEDYIPTQRLLQVITALIPSTLWPKPGENDNPNKVYTYSMKAKCLKEFDEIYIKAHDKNHPEHSKARELYQFYLDIAAEALQLYEKWKEHQGFRGTGLAMHR